MSLAEGAAEGKRDTLAARLAAATRRAPWSHLLDLVLPPLCLGCRRPLAEHGRLCSACWLRISFITRPRCDITGLPLPFDSGGRQISPRALAEPHEFDRARAVARFDDVMRHLIHGLKYGDRREGLALFGRWLALAGAELLADADLIVPVPLYRTRLWQRRFNQSALLAFELSRLTGVPADALTLRRRRATRSQVGLSEDQRRRNVAGAFMVPEPKTQLVQDRNILIIDDVLTTGATLDACARVLKRAGARRVDVLVLARVLDGGGDRF